MEFKNALPHVNENEKKIASKIVDLLREEEVTVYTALRILDYTQAIVPRCTLVKRGNATELQ